MDAEGLAGKIASNLSRKDSITHIEEMPNQASLSC